MKTRYVWALLLIVPVPASAITIETVLVGNAGNAPDHDYSGFGGFGAVGYEYRIGKFEVTNAQYAEFLNAVDPDGVNELSLYSEFMSLNPHGGIMREPLRPNGSKYVTKSGHEQNSVVWVNWFDAIRFANWMHNDQSGPGSTEVGAYTILGGTPVPSNLDTITRNTGARWFVPTEDEWYKAAYHQPFAAAGDIDHYWLYPTGTNATPFSDRPPGSNAPVASNTANFFADDQLANGYDDGYAVTGMTSRDLQQNYLTDVGAYPAATNYYGTYDQGGNAHEWLEGPFASQPSIGTTRGGGWTDRADILSAAVRAQSFRNDEFTYVGFRIAGIVPEPATPLLLTIAVFVALTSRSGFNMGRFKLS